MDNLLQKGNAVETEVLKPVLADASADGKQSVEDVHSALDLGEPDVGTTILEGVKVPGKLLPPGSSKELTLVGSGVRGVRLPNGLELKVTVLGIYSDPQIVKHLNEFKGLSAEELLIDDRFLEAFLKAPVEKLASVTMLLPLTGEDYASKSGQNTIMDLREAGKCGESEEQALKDYTEYFKQKDCPPRSTIYFSITDSGFEISQSLKSVIPKEAEIVVKSSVFGEALVGTMLSKKGVSPQTRAAFGEKMSTLLKKTSD